MADSITGFLSGAVRGAAKGALIGAVIVGSVGLIAATAGLGTAPVFVGAATTNALTVGLTAFLNFMAPIFTGVGALAMGTGAVVGGVRKGISNSIEQTHIRNEQEEMIELSQSARSSERGKNGLPRSQTQRNYVPPKAPNVLKDEMPNAWAKKIKSERKNVKQQSHQGHSH